MASSAGSSSGSFGALSSYRDVAASTRVLMVGAGGIGCELLKNLVLAGFVDIVIIDLDTIDVTNLNRQFLFQRQHVGKSKAEVAKESALKFNPDAKITAIHGSITTPDYGVGFYEGFDLVLNALDNRAARSHVNRMCLAANKPLVESGTAGYLGQVTVMQKGVTECYDCQPKPHQKTFPGCTIRNTPSEPIHCIVWAKHLFNQLFGESDPDEDVSPDAEDPELAEAKGEASSVPEEKENNGNVARVSTRQWAQESSYDAKSLFDKFFNEDIHYLLSMEKLWAKRTKPKPVAWDNVLTSADAADMENVVSSGIKDQTIWSLRQCARAFETAVKTLKEEFATLKEGDHLVWDKDDEAAMDFVTACANIRMVVFHIAQKSRFDVKSMAGNIIPAIATTNAVIAGCIVMEAIKILTFKNTHVCRTVYLTRKPNPRKKILVPCQLNPPNPKCYVCAERPEVRVRLNLEKTNLRTLEEKVLKGALNMIKPDAEIDGKGIGLISSEEGDMTDELYAKTLSSVGVSDGTILMCDDFLQKYTVYMILFHVDSLDNEAEFEMVGDVSASLPAETVEEDPSGDNSQKNGNGACAESNEGGIEVIEQTDVISPKKRKLEAEASEPATKRAKSNDVAAKGCEEDLICID